MVVLTPPNLDPVEMEIWIELTTIFCGDWVYNLQIDTMQSPRRALGLRPTYLTIYNILYNIR